MYNTGDTAWMLTSAALVLFMTPGLALFYGGMVRSKNALSTIMQSFFAMGMVTVIWAVIGYSLAFGNATGVLDNFIGGLQYVGLMGTNAAPNPLAPTIPGSVFSMYQLMFAIITVGLITGAMAERMKFSAYIVFTAIWVTVVYSPLAHWVWNAGGWLFKMGALDFAGGTVVHISSAAAALAVAILLGKRKGSAEDMHPHNLTMTILGAGILWFGWFGFNAGSAVGASPLAGAAFMNTQLAAAAAMITWLIAEKLHSGKATTLGAASGAVAGLVAITPAAGFVLTPAALIIGALAGVACYFGLFIKAKFGFDDALDVVGIHGVGGTLGAILTGVFATKALNPLIAGGVVDGNWGQLVPQFAGIAAAWIFSFVISFAVLYVLKKTMGIRVDEDAEYAGLDLSEHAETAYTL